MSNRIEVDTSALRDVSTKTDNFINNIKAKQGILKGYGDDLAAAWQGADASKFQQRYNAVVSDSGFIKELEDILADYRDYLKYCAEKYEKAAASAIERANGIR